MRRLWRTDRNARTIYEAGTVLEAQNLLELKTGGLFATLERARTAAGCYSYYKMRAEPQKGSAPFPARQWGTPQSPHPAAPLGLGPGSPLPHAMGMGVTDSPVPVHWVPTPLWAPSQDLGSATRTWHP